MRNLVIVNKYAEFVPRTVKDRWQEAQPYLIVRIPDRRTLPGTKYHIWNIGIANLEKEEDDRIK